MGVISDRKLPLPAPTESSVAGNDPELGASEIGTDLSQRTERTDHTHYSIPEDGREIKVPTKKVRLQKPTASGNNSQTSLLIEYFDARKAHEQSDGRPSVRVKVTPGARKVGNAKDVQITGLGKDRKPSYTRRISLSSKNDTKRPPASFTQQHGNNTLPSEPPSIEFEVMGQQSELSELPPESNVSSMPGDSLLDGPAKIKDPERSRSRSAERVEHNIRPESSDAAKLKVPELPRSRSLSKERITQKALEKIAREQSPEPEKRRRLQKSRPQSSGSELVEEGAKARSRRSSKSHRDSSDLRSHTESSLLPPRDNESNLSGNSKVSLNNPRLIATVEDAIRRLILPEIETIKRNQSVRSTQTRDSFMTEDSISRSGTNRRLSKSTSEPHVKSRKYDDHETRDGQQRRRRHKKSSRESDSDAASSRRDSLDSIAAEKARMRRSKDSSRRRDSRDTESSLTRANLKSHTKSSSRAPDGREDSDKSKQTSKSKSRSNSIAETEEEYYNREKIPPMPLNSEIQDSELTRTSLLSAETAESEDLQSKSDRTVEQPTKSTSRDIPTASPARSKTPRNVKSKESMELKKSRSDRSISSSKYRSAQLAAVGLGGAAGGLYGYKAGRESSRPSSSRKSSAEKRLPSREQSPSIRSERKGKDVDTQAIPEPHEAVKVERPPNVRGMSKDSIQTTSSVEYPVTTKRHLADKRHETLNYEDPELLKRDIEAGDMENRNEADEFYEDQHRVNDHYRTSLEEEDNPRDSTAWSKSFMHTPNDSIDNATFGTAEVGKTVKGIGANPRVIEDVNQPESAVASIVNQSMVSEQSQSSPPEQHALHHKEDVDRLDETREIQKHNETQLNSSPMQNRLSNSSAERWARLRDGAEQLSNDTSSRGSASPVKDDLQNVHFDASAIPGHDDEMPEIAYGQDEPSELTDYDSTKRAGSIVEGPLGDEWENKGLWPYEPTPDLERRGGYIHPHDRDSKSIDSGVAGALGATAGAGLGIGAAEISRSENASQPSIRQERSQPDTSNQPKNTGPQAPRAPPGSEREYSRPSPNAHKDEGYISAAHPRSPSVGSPLSFSKPPPQLFDDRDAAKYDQRPIRKQGPDVAVDNKHLSQFSADSHGMPAEAYNAATGEGMNNIESKDVVALMDHLTVRDAHRNARDTEILVTLVRSAAEMRDNFDELKNYVDMQGQLSRRHNTTDANQVVAKILNGTRSAAMSTSAPPRSSRFISPSSEKSEDQPPTKKKNIFKRALSGLGSRNEKDLSKIEDMLMQLLEDVESLKDVQASSLAGGSQRQIVPNKGSLDSYERLRAAPESGYEPDGQAGTGSTPNVSGTFSPGARQSSHRMHSGYNVTRDSNNRITTVPEHPEENIHNENYENDDGMLTPTQEAQQRRSGLAPSAAEYQTPPGGQNRGSSGGAAQYTPNTPRTGDSKPRQKSTSSSVFGGVPRSRWSKTTTSSAPGARDSYQRDRPYSEASRSGSDINVLPGGDGQTPYEVHDDDRLRSANSIARDDGHRQITGRSPSPLLPQDEAPIDDPKYHANRHSLTLEHPQPRQGSTHRHQTHLESQAYTYGGHQRAMSDKSSDRGGSPTSPNADIFGCAPTLAKNRFSTRSGRSTSGDYGTPQSTSSGVFRAPKVKDDSPLVPQTAAVTAARKETTGAGHRDSLDSSSGDSYEESVSQGSYRRHPRANAGADVAYDDEYSDEGESVPENTRTRDWEATSEHLSSSDGEDQRPYFPNPIPLERPRSPYYPGAQLTTIEERYSLEQSRISSPLSRHQSVKSKGNGSRIDEEFEGDGSTPTQSPAKISSESPRTPGSAGGSARKVTPSGPRAMPSGSRRNVSA